MINGYKYLKPKSHYSDLYDRFTVEECRWAEKSLKFDYPPKAKTKSKKKQQQVKIDLAPIILHCIKGERYIAKAQAIREWMTRDEALDERLDKAVQPKEVFCPFCASEMTMTSKDLQTNIDYSKNRVLFFFDCPSCQKVRLIYENGEDWQPMPVFCSKCQDKMTKKNKRKGNKITTIYTCSQCGHKKKEVLDLDEKPKPEKIDPNFTKDRQRFCLSEEEGRKYISSKQQLEHFSEMMKEYKEEEKIKEKTKDIKRLNITQLQQLLIKPLEKQGYGNLEFSKPEISRDVIIGFTIQDQKTDRKEYDSRIDLQRLVKKTLINTNWTLMSEGVSYRLGILRGRLRGYENNDDLVKLIKRKN